MSDRHTVIHAQLHGHFGPPRKQGEAPPEEDARVFRIVLDSGDIKTLAEALRKHLVCGIPVSLDVTHSSKGDSP